MLADCYIPGLSIDMKIVVQKNHLRDKILYRSPDPVKDGIYVKRRAYRSSVQIGVRPHKW